MVSVNPAPAVRMVRRGQARRSLAVFAAGVLAVVLLPIGGPDAGAVATPVPLGTAGSFSILAGSTVTNTGPSVVAGDVGVYPGSAIVGFPPGIVLPPGTIHAGDAVAAQAQTDLTTAYNNAAGQPADFILDSPEVGGRTLMPGVYRSPLDTGTLQITGQVTLDAQGDPNAVWVFQIPSTLITATNSSVLLVNGAQPCNVFWQVGSSATLGTDTALVGNILALSSITASTGATIQGRALARTGAVTLDSNVITDPLCQVAPTTTTTTTTTIATTTTVVPTTTTVVAPTTTTTSTPGNLPTNKDQCKTGGYAAFGFKNQGECVSFVATKK